MNNLIKQIIESKYNFNIDIATNNDLLLQKLSLQLLSQKITYENSLYVDMGLPSGIKWHKYNLGVNYNKLDSIEDWYGNYYAWGEINPKTNYTFKTYKWCKSPTDDSFTKYCTDECCGKVDNISKLQLEDDAAYLSNNKLQIPSKDDYIEMMHKSEPSFTRNYMDIEGLVGWIFESKETKALLFFPLSGIRVGKKFNNDGEGNYWTSDMIESNPYVAWAKECNYATFGNKQIEKCFGCSIRPIVKKE